MQLSLLSKFLKEWLRDPHSLQNPNFTMKLGPLRNYENKIINNGILISDIPSLKSINYARKNKFNLIITSNIPPFLSSGFIDEMDQKCLLLMLNSHMMHYELPKNWFWIKDGLNESLIGKIGLEVIQVKNIKEYNSRFIYICQPTIPTLSMNDFIRNLKRCLEIEMLTCMNFNEGDNLNRVIVQAGVEVDEYLVTEAYKNNCPVIISGQFSVSARFLATKYNLTLLKLPYLSSIRPGLQKVKLILSMQFPHLQVETFFHPDFEKFM